MATPSWTSKNNHSCPNCGEFPEPETKNKKCEIFTNTKQKFTSNECMVKVEKLTKTTNLVQLYFAPTFGLSNENETHISVRMECHPIHELTQLNIMATCDSVSLSAYVESTGPDIFTIILKHNANLKDKQAQLIISPFICRNSYNPQHKELHAPSE